MTDEVTVELVAVKVEEGRVAFPAGLVDIPGVHHCARDYILVEPSAWPMIERLFVTGLLYSGPYRTR